MTLSKKTLERLTLSKMINSRMSISRMTLGRMTSSKKQIHNSNYTDQPNVIMVILQIVIMLSVI